MDDHSKDPVDVNASDLDSSAEKGNGKIENSEKSPNKMSDKSPQKPQPQRQRSAKGLAYEVVLLDGEHATFELDKNAEGKELFEKVCQHLDLVEKDYFGLQYVDERLPHHLKCWLSPDKKISKQKKRGPWVFDLALKFYPPDPTQLRESLTRWLVTLQVRRDILSGKLPATFITQAMLGSYCVQADLGDYDPNEHHGIDYVKDIPFSPNQTPELLEKIVELHRQHKGQTPDEAEIHFLENAKKLSMYGVDLHAAKDVNDVDIMLGVCASGLQVYREKLRISRFVWPKILKISYKRKHFYIKIRPSENSQLENTVCFKLASHRLAKRLWKICVEHHAFFRLRETEQPQNSAMFPRLGSKFRYSGRTLYQARHNSQILDRPDPYFERNQTASRTMPIQSNRSRSVDEINNRPDQWRDDDYGTKRRPSEGQDGRDARDKRDIGQPTPLAQVGLPPGMKPYENDEEKALKKGADKSNDTFDRRDQIPGGDITEKGKQGQDAMGLSEAEALKKAKEDEKERKRREKEEEKRRKKEEDEKKKADKKNKGKKAEEDRRDLKGSGEPTETLAGRTPGSYADQEGDNLRYAEKAAPLGSAADGSKGDQDGKDRRPWGDDDGIGGKRESLGTSPGWFDSDQDKDEYGDKDLRKGRGNWDKDQFGDKDGKDKYGKDGDKDGKDKYGKDGDKDGKDKYGKDGDKYGKDDDKYGKDGGMYGRDGNRDGKDGDKDGKGKDGKGKDGKDKDGKDKDHDGKDKKPGVFSGLLKKPKDAKSSEDAYGPGHRGQGPTTQGAGYGPGYFVPGMGIGAGDLSGVVGKESWIENKQRFLPVPDPVKASKDKLKTGVDVDRTMPFFSPAATSTVGRPTKVPPPVPRKSNTSFGGDDSLSKTDMPPTVATESVQYNPDLEEVPVPTRNVPIVKTETRTVTYEREGFPLLDSEDGVLVSSRSHSTKMQTIETTTYKMDRDGIQETRVEHRVVLSSADDDFDYDAALVDAIRSVTEFNPDMSVERIECVQQIEEVRGKF
ncbi:LOW QUALITY PROTEIN: protein 4.1-like [Pomacea canaliculata]|uniref:LOW QUALITY PROTEIN: protein 4.1-like n=1 Tax=Pomacea canaliculata TaxID=400727 RepID=UPI000D725736|nr:LOW QUALITY PROTEIN: protein 4.1-like [Pomacea canaliculata]